MTVLVGVLCQEGVILGSDSSATFAAGNLNTIEQSVQKTFVIGNDVILATTGAGGLGQRLQHILQTLRGLREFHWSEKHWYELVCEVCRSMLQNMQATYLEPGQVGALLAFACQNTFHLCEFGVTDFQPEMKDPRSWFVSMGSGQMITDPFFGLLRRTMFRDSQPTLNEGGFAASWALHNAIQLNTGGINGPIQLAELRRLGPGLAFQARLFGNEELAEHGGAVKSIENYLADYRPHLVSTTDIIKPLPEPPATP